MMRKIVWPALILLAAASAARAGAPGYKDEVRKWREARETRLKGPDGWLTVAGLFWLREGDNRFGSAPDNDIVLPPSAPAHAGTFRRKGDAVTALLEDGSSVAMETDKTRITLGPLTLLVHASGSRLGIRLKDPDSALRKSFRGLKWFAVDPKWRITAKWVPYDPPKTAQVENVLGDIAREKVPGYAELSLEGKTYRLEPEQDEDGSLEFVFRDGTSGRETYGAARFVDTAPPKDGTVVLDFNEAYNPPCAYNRYTTCPLPPPGNRMSARIPAGEKAYKGAH
jgi:uncharacterized protein (DUF1684 family)